MSYYDVDEILTEAQKIPLKFEADLEGCGFLENTGVPNIKPGTTISLPYWLAYFLIETKDPHTGDPLLTADFPPSLSPAVISALRSDPKTLDLRSQARYFYALALSMLELFEDEDGLGETLVRSYGERAGWIGDFCAGNRGGRGEEFLRGLEEWERRVFRRGEEGGRRVREWMGERRKGGV